ncbi:SIMPL domain-containing protein [Leptothoe sp. PORK10 BA2]|uniref:SIMPL domain-containing protein n=1 Tax=Leptothoe sp. PORK10 BA2 TaxID=3110254 RepID=UPI002B1F49CA|nr:SIMPL domain-containing protein [Leptothoe sp. PORK10 BA2]MEA5464293.1 SIMPL domain-containing protein [Leptothoe sp. PORK10 BA2]
MQRLTKLTQRLLPWILTVILLLTLGGLPAAAQNSSTPRMMVVTGHGRDQAPTTLAQISLGISDQGDAAKTTYGKVNKRTVAVVKLLKSKQVENVKTTNINLSPKYDRDGKPQKGSYEGYQNIEFQVSADDMGVLDDAIATDINQLNSIQYVASESALIAARKTALEAAIADGQAQAKAALDKLGFSIQEIVDIQVNNAQIPGNSAVVENGEDSSYASWSPGQPVPAGGEQIVEVDVTLKIRY